MSTEHQTGATNKPDNLDKSTANDTGRMNAANTESNYPNKAADSKGAGSPYGGTQSADPHAPDGNQQVNTGATDDTSGESTLPEGQGDEYGSQSSYGSKGSDREGDDNGEGDARGFVNR
jgi:hypothetical protein